MPRFLWFVALWLALWWSIVGTLLAPVIVGGWLGVLGLVALTTAPIAVIVHGRGGGRTPGALSRLLVLRPFVYAQLALPLLAIAGLLGGIGGAVVGRAGRVGRWSLAVVAVLYVVFALLGFFGSRRLTRTHVTVRLPDLPPAFDGLRIVQISDTHVGPQTSRRHLARIAALAAAARPDLIVVTGDLVDDHAGDVPCYARALGALSAPFGTFAVPGNHDVYAGWPAVRERLEALPLTVLVNAWRPIERDGARLVLLGTGDPAGGRRGTAFGGPELDEAFDGVPANAFVIALAHNPVLWPSLARRGVRLTLSGHTHWGQLAIPRLGWSLASPFNRHPMGGYVDGDAALYVHPGSNFWGIPFRLGTPPEVAVVELRRGATTEITRA